jgi:ammonia channel protein AmtB
MEFPTEQKLNESKDDSKQYVTTGVLSAITGIMIIAIGWLFFTNNALSARVDTMSISYVSIQTQLSQIQTDLSWIKESLVKDKK